MKLSKHKLPKISNKVVRTAKHKDSAVKKSRVEEKSNKMAVDAAPIPVVSDEAKEQAKQLRKRENAHRVSYKKNNYNMTGRQGPRAVSGHSVGTTISLR